MLVDYGFNSSTVVSFLFFFPIWTNEHEIVLISSSIKRRERSFLGSMQTAEEQSISWILCPSRHLSFQNIVLAPSPVSVENCHGEDWPRPIQLGLLQPSLTFSTKENNTHAMKKSNRIGLQECMHDWYHSQPLTNTRSCESFFTYSHMQKDFILLGNLLESIVHRIAALGWKILV